MVQEPVPFFRRVSDRLGTVEAAKIVDLARLGAGVIDLDLSSAPPHWRSRMARHSALVRATHWITALCFLALLVSGIEIVISHPRFYWGETGNILTTPLFQLPIPSSRALVETGWDSIDMADALHPQTLLVHGMNGGDLPVGHGGPIRIRVPRQLGYKSVKFINRLTVTDSLKGFGKGLGSSSAEAGYAWYVGI